jgi:quinol monooxygenase YgiN
MVSIRTRYEPGCLQTGIWMDLDNGEVMVFEVWRAKADFTQHVKSPLYKRFLVALEMSSEQPKVSISECVDVRGFEMIEEAMTNKNSIV